MKIAGRIIVVASLFISADALQAQWTQTNGPYGANITCFAVSGTDLYAGTFNDGIFLSTNGGASWSQVNNGLTNLFVHTIAVSGTHVFAGTNGGLFLSTSNGANWNEVTSNFLTYPQTINALAVSGSTIWAAGGYGVFRSTDNGSSWVDTQPNIYAVALATSGTHVFAANNNGKGICLSTDNGASWTQVNSGLGSLYVSSLAASGTNIFAGLNGGGVYLTSNNGASWTGVNVGLTNPNVNGLTVSGPNIFAGTTSGVFISTNNGSTWIPANTGLPNTSVAALASVGTNIIAGTAYGVFVSSNNGSSWTSANTGLTNTNVFALAAIGANIFAGTDVSGVFLSSNNGAGWSEIDNGLSNLNIHSMVACPNGAGGSNIFAGSMGGGVFVSTNGGGSWIPASTGLAGKYAYALASIGPDVFVGTDSGVFVTTNSGGSWALTNSGLTNTSVTALAASGAELFAGTNGGVFLSTNNGASWISASAGLTKPYVSSLAVAGSNIYAGLCYGGGIFRSTDNGTSWVAVNSSLQGNYTELAAFGTNIFVGTDFGHVFLSTNNGTSWTDTGLPNHGIEGFVVSDNKVFAGTYGGGVWSSAWNFIPGTPSLVALPNGVTDASLSPTLWWNAAGGAVSYRLQVSTDPNFDSTVIDQSNVNVASFSVSALQGGTEYYWRVNASNSVGTSSWSNVCSFTTAVAAPSAPTLSSPANGSAGISASPSLSWNASIGAASYRLQVSTDSTFATTFYDQSNLTTTSQSVSGLKNNKKYYWRVNASSASGTSVWSNTWNFTTAVVALSITSPLGGEEWYAGTTHIIQWFSSNVAMIKIEFSGDSGETWRTVAGSVQALQDTLGWLVPDISSNNCLIKIVDLSDTTISSQSPGTFKILNQVGSPGWTYTITGNNHIILIPLSANPMINDSAIIAGDYIGVFYDSSATLACGGYAVWDGTRNISVTAWGNDPTSPSPDGFGNGEIFKWRIWQQKTGKTFSAHATYTVNSQLPNDSIFVSNGISSLASLNGYQIVNSIEKTQIIPKDFALYQNFPNPFNPSTMISYNLPKRAHVMLTVYDVLGREVRVVVNIVEQPGGYEVNFNASDLPSGVYFYRLTAGSFVATKKLLLLK